ncbi:P-type DNA transfer ATPase VirB11 [Sphingobium sp. SJ10-10]|uniref:P-type DNA transfer ATPase VirB11 n=1 Tax=Sphingobium sp. SJ10-10 TaxID=3114999 RepID=UPI002E19D5CA|nr:P-type DNA transfer ATPase VirB11 [Sphingobium sp. SJ10-10]
MSNSATNIYLESCLAPLGAYLGRRDVTDIYINQPGEIWLETLGGSIDRITIPELQAEVLGRLARQIAAITGQGINREHPLLAASLPTGERIQIVLPPATRGDIAFAIRKHVASDLSLKDYQIGSPVEAELLAVDNGCATDAMFVIPEEGDASFLGDAVRERRNILISGGTSSGKTTFLNVLLSEIPAHERLILIEDAPELNPRNENSVGLLAPRGVMGEAAITAEDLLIAALRMRPDRIILGEIRGSEASTFLRAINTGHPGSLSTIHADSPARAIDQLALLVLQTGMRMSWSDVVTYVRRSIDIIVQLRRGGDRRRIESIYYVED